MPLGFWNTFAAHELVQLQYVHHDCQAQLKGLELSREMRNPILFETLLESFWYS